jgi:hypothetical protein
MALEVLDVVARIIVILSPVVGYSESIVPLLPSYFLFSLTRNKAKGPVWKNCMTTAISEPEGFTAHERATRCDD